LALNLTGQYANKNLDSLEKFSFGGVNGVRAYNSNIGVGDEGVLANLSYSMLLNTALPTRIGVFYDHAFVKASHAPWEGLFDGLEYGNNYQLNAAGLQLTTGYKGLVFNAAAAYPVNKKPVDPNQRWRLWAQVTYSF
jgi:hemolysin activation/secretion protein